MQKLFSWISFQCRPLAPPRARPVCPTMFRVQTRSLRSLSFICDVFECLMFNGSILSLLCRVRECLCWRVRTSMRRSQKRRQTNYPKRGRERDRSCRPFPVRAFVCPCEVCLCCTFVFLCVCVCVSKSVSFFFGDFSTQQGAYGQLDGVGHRRPIQIAVKMSLLPDMVMKQCLN